MNAAHTAAAVAGSHANRPDDERTPLISTVPTRPYHRAHRSTTCTRFIYVLAQVVLFYSILYLLVLLPLNLIPHFHSPWTDIPAPYQRYPLPRNKDLPLEKLYKILDETPSPDKIKEWSKYYTSGQHVAGRNYSQALWTKEQWEKFGIKSEIVEYEVLLNYPTGHRLALLESSSDSEGNEKVIFEASLEEDEIPGDKFSQSKDRLPTFHGYSADGNVTAEYVYAGYCTQDDFKFLKELKVPIKGNIVLCRYGLIFRGLKVMGAQEKGAVGVVIFTDPGDDHPDGWSGGGGGSGGPYPKGSERQPSSVQRGSVQFTSLRPGDPTTPGYASKPGVPRTPAHEAIPSIPSLPISYLDAVPILKALNGWGSKPKGWEGGLVGKGVEYWTGPIGVKAATNGEIDTVETTKTKVDPATKTLLNLYNGVEFTITPIWDVIGVINGSLSDEVVVIGNHRDAWCAGAADPVSGSSSVMEVIASWDGEEYGLVGSTEWVEDQRSYLMQNAVAYLNLDIATSGSWLDPASAPLMYKPFINAMKSKKEIENMASSNAELEHIFQDRDRESYKDTIYEFWARNGVPIRPVGSGSDFVGFQDIAMVPSMDFSFRQDKNGAVYHYHSNYDSFEWMEKYGDPGFKYHVVAAKMVGHAALEVIETPVIPFNLTDYALFLEKYYKQALKAFDKKTGGDTTSGIHDSNAIRQARDALVKVDGQIAKLKIATQALDEEATGLTAEVRGLPRDIPWYKRWQHLHYWTKIKSLNKKIMFFERKFAYEDGLDGRNVYKHVVFAPGLWTGYSGAVFPGILESIEDRNFTNVERWSEIIQKCIIDATRSIE
ncbi:hypothetical protein ABW19_dt0208454 [Dactylella cylindrospora]|nr:hypothetical protein ABW19_dt0208454 [Dactylella cylindrospora]